MPDGRDLILALEFLLTKASLGKNTGFQEARTWAVMVVGTMKVTLG